MTEPEINDNFHLVEPPADLVDAYNDDGARAINEYVETRAANMVIPGTGSQRPRRARRQQPTGNDTATYSTFGNDGRQQARRARRRAPNANSANQTGGSHRQPPELLPPTYIVISVAISLLFLLLAALTRHDTQHLQLSYPPATIVPAAIPDPTPWQPQPQPTARLRRHR